MSVYSEKLKRRINVQIEHLNQFETAELNAALEAMPGYPDTGPDDIRAEAARGSLDARLIIERAEAGDREAQEWLGM